MKKNCSLSVSSRTSFISQDAAESLPKSLASTHHEVVNGDNGVDDIENGKILLAIEKEEITKMKSIYIWGLRNAYRKLYRITENDDSESYESS